jgi:SAM-dependent methyltransferase
MLTVDYRRLGVKPGDRVLDLGCGAGRHAYEAMRLGARVVAYDLDTAEIKDTAVLMESLVPDCPGGASGSAVNGDARYLPFADGSFDRVIAAEVLEHIPADAVVLRELTRVLRPGGTIAVSVPRFGPELANWALSDEYHNIPGGHIRIYRGSVLAGLRPRHPLALLVAPVRGRRQERRPPPGAGLPPGPRVGHRAATGRVRSDPARRRGQHAVHRQVDGALRGRGAWLSTSSPTCPAS